MCSLNYIMNFEELINNWNTIDKSSFTENIELEYSKDDPLFIKLKFIAEQNNIELSEFISAIIYDWYLKETKSKE